MSQAAKTMRAIIKPDSSPGLKMVDVPLPSPGAGEALIKVAATSICGTDLPIYQWDPWARSRIKPPMICGHEFCGHVVEIGARVSEATVYGIVGRKIRETWFRRRGLPNSSQVDLTQVITHRFALDQYEKALRVMQSGQSGKVIMFPD